MTASTTAPHLAPPAPATTPVPATPTRHTTARPRDVRLQLRDGDWVDGRVFLTDGHFLAPYLGSRKGGWLNVVGAMWASEGVEHQHAVVQADDILWAVCVDPDVRLGLGGASAGAIAREVDILLEDGTRLHGCIQLAPRQRLSDYLSGCGRFIPVTDAARPHGGEPFGEIALNSEAVKAVRDGRVLAAGLEFDGVRRVDWGGVQRPASESPPAPAEEPGHDDPGPVDVPLTTAEQARRDRLSRHWLVQVAERARLEPPDPRPLDDRPSLGALWDGVTTRNELSSVELAVHVTTQFRLPLADLDAVTADALRLVPERVARKLGILPLRSDARALTIAVSDPASMEIEQQLGFVTRLALRCEVAAPDEIARAIDWYYGGEDGEPRARLAG